MDSVQVKREIVIEVRENQTNIALLENSQLQEFNVENSRENLCSVGDIYLGRVRKVMPALNAAFVDIGSEKGAFLHFSDLGGMFLTQQAYIKRLAVDRRLPAITKIHKEKEKEKDGKIEDFLQVGDVVPVQIFKEPINTKGPRLTSELSIAGRNIVLVPFADKVMVSSKIKKESEKQRLKELMLAIKPEGFGCIIRTLAEGKKVAELDHEMNVLKKRWTDILRKVQNFYKEVEDAKNKKESILLYKEVGRAIGFIRDVFSNDFTNIHVNDLELREEIKDYIQMVAPESVKKVKLYKGQAPIFDYFGVTKQLKVGMGRTVSLKSGGYLVIDRTEALVAIDVNSGSKKIFDDHEQNAFEYNRLATEEIAHILRLRDIGGIIIIDYIDMESKKNQQAIYDQMCALLSRDRAKHHVLPLSKFGLMQITRQRIRPAIVVNVNEVCPTCLGKGKIQSSILFHENIEAEIKKIKDFIQAEKKDVGKVTMHVHPYLYSFINRGFLLSIKHQWQRRYDIKIIEDQQLGMMELQFYDEAGHRIKTAE